jgi:hypothetical protein
MQGDARRVPEVNLLPEVDPLGITEKNPYKAFWKPIFLGIHP